MIHHRHRHHPHQKEAGSGAVAAQLSTKIMKPRRNRRIPVVRPHPVLTPLAYCLAGASFAAVGNFFLLFMSGGGRWGERVPFGMNPFLKSTKLVASEAEGSAAIGTQAGDDTETEETARLRLLRYSDLAPPDLPPPILDDPPDLYPVTTAFSETTVIRSSPWFVPQTICAAPTCCATSVAVSLRQDDARLINAMDGDDLSEVRVRPFRERLLPTERYVMRGERKAAVNFTHLASDLTEDVAPCLRPGALIHVDAFPALLEEFFSKYRPLISVPYVLLTGGTDNPSPPEQYLEVLDADDLLLRWYGTNAQIDAIGHPRFRARPLGLSRDYMLQQRELTALEQSRGGMNPFGRSGKARWTQEGGLCPGLWGEDVNDTTNALFVNFALSKAKGTLHRGGPWRMVCDGRSGAVAPVERSVSCRAGFAPIRDVYRAASLYPFGLSPPGRGTDCFRTYEFLMLGVIPVVWDHPMYNDLLKGLPHVRLEGLNYTQSDLLGLLRDYVRSDEFLGDDFDEGWERMHLRYWRREALRDGGRDRGEDVVLRDEDGREYYRSWVYTSMKKRG